VTIAFAAQATSSPHGLALPCITLYRLSDSAKLGPSQPRLCGHCVKFVTDYLGLLPCIVVSGVSVTPRGKGVLAGRQNSKSGS
jgi:hypothetical protein